ncbi:hypothetical protein [Larkinella humicola]|uniref:Guanylate cyclase domain-containing protein n=1 Tax=Larkinella humicola TaxID=2607654 RepID=A0A5N1JCM3_9BACT|nr:hypothetical protein [Larkinella humicola]KAA9353024.1 hypothetical protein F0P93_17765 [Larkinella humicola]
MHQLNISYKYFIDPKNGISLEVDNDLKDFTSELLNIGDLKTPSKPVEVLAVIMDLEGFTTFTRQVDPKLAIPSFVSDFFNWLFDKIRDEMHISKENKTLWAELPFFSKFLGDGVLFLWRIDTDKISAIDSQLSSERINHLTQELICNIIATLYEICRDYPNFLKERELNYVDPPTRLRCGIARGDAFPLGINKDFVGPCINIASRLQKFNDLSFGVSARGIDHNYFGEGYKKFFLKKKVYIRGIGENEIIYLLNDEYKQLSEEAKMIFK